MRDLTYRQALLEAQAEPLSEKWLVLRWQQKLGPYGAQLIGEMFQDLTAEAYLERQADRRRAIDRMAKLAGLK